MTTGDCVERRHAPRVRPEGNIQVRLFASGRLDTGTLIDVNNGGAFVATDLVLDKGESVHMELDIPGVVEPRPICAIVARCSEEIRGEKKVIPAGLGLVFIGNTPEESRLIQQVVMSTLTLDLLSFSYEQQWKARSTSDTRPTGIEPPEGVSRSS